MKLFDFFDKTYLINLDRREDRLKNFINQVEKYDLGEFERVSAIDGKTLNLDDYSKNLTSGELGLVLTNLSIVREAKSMGYKRILIVEDDCIFSDEVLKIDDYIADLPNDWDMLYMGGNHNIHVGADPPEIINDRVCKLHSTYSTHFVGIKNTVFDHILSILPKYANPIDVSYVLLQKSFNVYSFYPALASQLIDYSDIQEKVTDYSWLIN